MLEAAATTARYTGRPRVGNRRKMRLQGRLTWRDAGGVLKCASVVTQDVSDLDAFVECQAPASIPLYRLVHFQLERASRDRAEAELPVAFQRGKILSAVYRVGPSLAATGTPQGYALRLLVEPSGPTSSPARKLSTAMTN